MQMNGCILENGRAGRACIKEKAMMHDSSMIYCGKFIPSQFEPLCEKCAVLVDGHVVSGSAMIGSRPNSHGAMLFQEKHGAEATEQRSMGVLRVKRASNGNVPKHEVAGVLLSGAFFNFDPGVSRAPDKVLCAPEIKCVESFADKTSTFDVAGSVEEHMLQREALTHSTRLRPRSKTRNEDMNLFKQQHLLSAGGMQMLLNGLKALS